MRKYFSSFFLIVLMSLAGPVLADDQSLLVDVNGDGAVSVLSFGDSLTFGVGDNGIEPTSSVKGGYPQRTATLLGVPFQNQGLPGEELTLTGAERFAGLVQGSSADVAIILEGANDAYRSIDYGTYRDAVQRSINIAVAAGKTPLLATLPTPCCEHGQLAPYTVGYSDEIKALALINELKVVDLYRVWKTTCVNPGECELYNLPEGLHPTAAGYDVISQAFAATFVGVDVFEPDGASKLESALGLQPGTVKVKPDTVSQ